VVVSKAQDGGLTIVLSATEVKVIAKYHSEPGAVEQAVSATLGGMIAQGRVAIYKALAPADREKIDQVMDSLIPPDGPKPVEKPVDLSGNLKP
jgi:hypothetical protein